LRSRSWSLSLVFLVTPISIDPSSLLSLVSVFSLLGSRQSRGSLVELSALGLEVCDVGEVEANQGGGGVSQDPSQSEKGKKVSAGGAGTEGSSSKSGEQVEHMMAWLRITAAESTAVINDKLLCN
jgi:hypothetical protein